MFLHVSVILFTGGCYPSMHCRWYPSMPRGVCSQGGAHSGGDLLLGGACSVGGGGGDPPEGRRLLVRTLRILLECILVGWSNHLSWAATTQLILRYTLSQYTPIYGSYTLHGTEYGGFLHFNQTGCIL